MSRSKHSPDEKLQAVMESLNGNTTQAEVCRRYGIFPMQLSKWKKQFLEEGEDALPHNSRGDEREEEIENLKRIIGEQSLVIDAFKKRTTREDNVMIVHNFKQYMSVREIACISGIPLSEYYYVPRSRNVTRLDPSIREMIKRIASERPTYGYRRIWAVLRNQGIRVNSKTVESVLREDSLSLPYARRRGRTKTRNLFRPTGPDQLWETDINYIATQQGMTYLMAIKDCFTKEWQGYNFSRSRLVSDAVRAVEDAILRTFDGQVPDGLVLSVDNGPQYISQQFRSAMNLLGIHIEYIQKNTPEDNGNIESFHNSFKTDYAWPYEFQNYGEASVTIKNAFKDYNENRPHSSIEYLPPGEFRGKVLNDQLFRDSYIKKMEAKLNEKS